MSLFSYWQNTWEGQKYRVMPLCLSKAFIEQNGNANTAVTLSSGEQGMSNKPSLVLAKTEEGRFLWPVEEYINLFVSAHASPNSTCHSMQAWCQPRPCPLQHLHRLYPWGFILLPKFVQLSCRGNRNPEVKKMSSWIERFSCETSRNTDVEQHKTQESQKNIHTHTYICFIGTWFHILNHDTSNKTRTGL